MAREEKKKELKYDIIISNRMVELVDKVNESIEKGWKPQGGIQTMANYFYQAISR